MKKVNSLLLLVSAGSLALLFYCCIAKEYRFINWAVSLCYWIGAFAFLLFLVRIFFKPGPKTYLLFFSAFCAILIAEAMLRAFHIGSLYLERRNGFYQSPFTPQENSWFHVWSPNGTHELKNIEYTYSRSTNSLGLSDVEFDKSKKANAIRIVDIGDSFTEGDGSPADSTWSKRLQSNLKKKYPDISFDVYNAGVCGSDPFFSYQLLHEKLILYHPDVVVMTVNNSDIDDYIFRGGMERFLPDSTTQYRPHPWFESLYAVSFINRLAINDALKLDQNLMAENEKKKIIPKALRDMTAILIEADSLCRSNGCKLIVLFHPMKFEYQDKSYYAIQPIIDSLTKEPQIVVFNFLDYLLKDKDISANNIGSYYWFIDGHHNSKGYMLLGDALTSKVILELNPRLDSLSSMVK